MESIWNLIIYFAVCAFIGWGIEQPIAITKKRRLQNLGVLSGPFVPIYGFVGVITYFFSLILFNFPFQFQLLVYAMIPTVIEFFTSFFLEKFFKIRFWDYSKFKFNLNGRVHLILSILWGILLIIGVYFFQPLALRKILDIPETARIIISILILIFLLTDFIFSVRHLVKRIKKEINVYIRKGILLNPKIKNSLNVKWNFLAKNKKA